ncbi:uncharacterized protein LOC142162247 [Nicotiana tabacum]|uniref:Uncharacterized protein LOC142162247 n=1 Tax=Nicotiana tabacum TaxID=4097 RepID=A0AC58RPN4_TOBAC
MSPYELLYRKKPLLGHLRVLGCLCYAKIVNKADKLQPTAIIAVHMGYSSSHKGYILLNLSTNSFFVNRDVTLREVIFPFQQFSSYKQSVFPNTSSSVLPMLLSDGMLKMLQQNPTRILLHMTLQSHHMQALPLLAAPTQVQDHYQLIYHQASIASSSLEVEPVSYVEAIKDLRWVAAMKSEIATLEDNHTWNVVPLPHVIVKTILSIAAMQHWHIHQMNVSNAFLQGDLYDEIYIDLP